MWPAICRNWRFNTCSACTPSGRRQFEATVDMLPDIEQLLIDDTGGYPINVNWHNGDDIFLFTKKPLNLPADVQDMKTRAFGHVHFRLD